METRHRIVVGDSRSLSALDDDSVELVVTSPPYPMIEMWDELFVELDPAIQGRLEDDDGAGAFELMHEQLDAVWTELERVLVEGGIACINVGDATRTLDGNFRVYQNHSRIVDAFERRGFEPLPEILWRKPGNSGAKFMGSGMVPPNAYVTLEHEYILPFRKGQQRRSFEPNADRRYSAAYFWEERNQWFSDLWTGVSGEFQSLQREQLRERSGAFPFEIPYRLVNMYSVYGDTVLDPFWGTGTTSLAAMTAARHSVGYELSGEFMAVFDDRLAGIAERSRAVTCQRLRNHREFVAERREAGEVLRYEADNYTFPVRTRQERTIQLYAVDAVEETDWGYRVVHEPVNDCADADRSE